MRLKALGVAVPALAVAIAIVIAIPDSSRGGEENDTEIVLCKTNGSQLCDDDELWGTGKLVEGLSPKVEFLGAITVTCNHASFLGRFTPKMAQKLQWTIEGANATITDCGLQCPSIKVSTTPALVGEVSVAAGDKYSMLFPIKVTTECTPGNKCTYNGDPVLPIDNPNTSGEPVLLAVKASLGKATGTNCPAGDLLWDAEIKLKGLTLHVLFTLFELNKHQEELQPAEEAHEEELFGEEWHEELLHAEELT